MLKINLDNHILMMEIKYGNSQETPGVRFSLNVQVTISENTASMF
jgi:hypothetical protein